MEEAAGGGGAGHDGVEEERAAASAAEVYCAVGKDAGKEWRANLRWVLANFPSRSRSQSHRLVLVLAHVHRPPRLINIMGAWVPVSQVADREVAAYRKLEEDKASRALDDLLRICKTQRVHARKVLVAGDDTAAALLQLVQDNGVVELVMGAAADRAYSRKMRAPRSKKAAKVQRKASPSCRIWFVCKGNLVCTREASEGQSSAEPSTGSTSPRPSASEHSTSKSSPPRLLLPLQGDDPTTSLRRDPSRDGSSNATDDGAEHSGHGVAAVVAEARPPTAFQPEPEGGGETEERLAVEQDRQELDETREVDGRSFDPEIQVAGSECAIGELDVGMPESSSVLDALQLELPAADTVQEPMSAAGGGDQGESFVRFRLSELEEATNSFDDAARIGGGGSGRGRGGVYRGTLRGMSVAVKIICPDVTVHDEARFARAADAVARARHPGLVPLVGACPEARALVHELVPGGNLEDRLAAVPGAPPLPWHARCGVAYRTCAALAFLHSTATVHGDVRAANILFEDDDERRSSSSSKLAGLGTSMLAAPKRAGRAALAYVDPRYRATGELTPQCDVHALGVVLLRLVTGKRASAARKAAREAATGTGAGRGWREVADARAGGWPVERARVVAILGLKCCYVSDGRVRPRPAASLLEEARSVLETVTNAAPGRSLSSLPSSARSSRFRHEGVVGERARHVADDQPEAPHRRAYCAQPRPPHRHPGVALAPHQAA